MKFVLAPDSYKGSLTAIQACDAMEEGIRRVIPDAAIIKVPMADGGEGTVQSLVDAMNGHLVQATVKNPLGEPVLAKYGILQDQDTAVIEMAEASGLYLLDADRRNPLLTSTFGTGELILDALNHGCRKFILCIGGSSTNDGGAGMAQALGAKLVDEAGEDLPYGGGSLNRLHRIDVADLDPRIKESSFTVACDVDNTLCGVRGASYVFGPQKGATAEMIAILDQNLEHYAHLIEKQLGKSVRDLPGAGAAGGLGAGITAFLEGSLKKGVELVIEATRLEEKISGADLVLSGEGQSDFQTKFGKTPFGVAKAASKSAVPVVLISGSIGKGIEELYEHGVTSVFSMIDRPMPLEDAMTNARQLLTDMTERVIRLKFSSLTRTIY